MSAFNERQYEKMLESLAGFKEHRLSLPKCIGNLKGLIACLENPDSEVKSALQKNWAILEEVYAVSEDQGLSELPLEYHALVARAISEMKGVLEKVLAGK